MRSTEDHCNECEGFLTFEEEERRHNLEREAKYLKEDIENLLIEFEEKEEALKRLHNEIEVKKEELEELEIG